MDPETVHKLIHCNLQHLQLLHPAPYAFTEVQLLFCCCNFISLQKVMHHCLKLYIIEILVPIEDGPVRIFYDISAALYHFLLSFFTLY